MRVLIVDDEPANVEYTLRTLSRFEPTGFVVPEDALRYGETTAFDVALVDQRMPNLSGLELIRRLKARNNDFAAIVVSAYTDSQDLIDAVNGNTIFRYIVKPVAPDDLVAHVEDAYADIERRRQERAREAALTETAASLRSENERLKAQISSPLDRFFGTTPEVAILKKRISVYAAMDDPILIEGETGTGKELLAQAVHRLSSRSDGPFYAVNCAAIPSHVVESELFGHTKGAFTGADRATEGIFAAADGGTLFLDEVAELPTEIQPKLLRVLQFGTYYPVGSRSERRCNVRLVAASNRPLSDLSAEGTIRQDLLYRINTLTIRVPPLRERRADILPLCAIIAERRGLRLPHFTDGAKKAITEYAYPGNVRELENLLIQLHAEFTLSGKAEVDATSIRALLGESDESPPVTTTADRVLHDGVTLSEYLLAAEREVIAQCHALVGGNISRMAEQLDITRQSVRNKLRRFGLYERPDDDER